MCNPITKIRPVAIVLPGTSNDGMDSSKQMSSWGQSSPDLTKQNGSWAGLLSGIVVAKILGVEIQIAYRVQECDETQKKFIQPVEVRISREIRLIGTFVSSKTNKAVLTQGLDKLYQFDYIHR